MDSDCYLEGVKAFRIRRYSADTRARLYSGLLGTDACDKAFRRGYEDERRRLSVQSEWDEDIHGDG